MRRKLKGGIGKRLTKKDIENRQRAFFTTQRRSRHRDMSPKISAIGARAKRLEKQWAREKKEEEGMTKRSSARTQEGIGQDRDFQDAWNRAQHWERERKKHGLKSSVPHGDHVGAYHHANLNNRLTAHMKGF